jgi:hypothetical protein
MPLKNFKHLKVPKTQLNNIPTQTPIPTQRKHALQDKHACTFLYI